MYGLDGWTVGGAVFQARGPGAPGTKNACSRVPQALGTVARRKAANGSPPAAACVIALDVFIALLYYESLYCRTVKQPRSHCLMNGVYSFVGRKPDASGASPGSTVSSSDGATVTEPSMPPSAAESVAVPRTSDDVGAVYVGRQIPASPSAFATLVEICKTAHSDGGKMLASQFDRKCRTSFTPADAAAHLQLDSNEYQEGTVVYKVLRRGHFYCGVDGCTWAVPFTFHSEKANPRYQVVPSAGPVVFCLSHNHPPTAASVATTDGKTLVSSEKVLQAVEMAEILRFATSYTSMPAIQLELRGKFPHREIHHEVIKRILKKERDRIFGKDRHRISDLQAKGKEIRANGGIFAEKISPNTYRLESIAMQTAKMKLYAIQYGSYFTLMDGSHKMNVYNLQTIPCTTIDCLGKSAIIGLGCGLGESIVNCTALGNTFSFGGSVGDNQLVSSLAWMRK